MSRFIDRVTLHLRAGNGGHGCNSILREKFKPLGGPDGGNGGHGGDIILKVDPQVHTLLDFHFRPHITAGNGSPGAGDNRNGARGEDLIMGVPEGTVVSDAEGNVLADLMGTGTEFVAAEGGYGGLGNAALANRYRRAPGFALLGEPGEERELTLELKSMADVGLVGFPSAGKSSLVSAISAAKPKIGDYPFTTLQPNLGVVQVSHDSFTIADVPGLIPGASEGKGLGLDFLRHIERCAVLVHVVDCATFESDRDPVSDIRAMEHELANYTESLTKSSTLGDLMSRPRVIVLNKLDVPDARDMAEMMSEEIASFGWPVFEISTATHQGLDQLRYKLLELVNQHRKDHPVTSTAPAQVIRPQGVSRRVKDFTIEADPDIDGGFLVLGRKPERWIHQTDFENDEAVGYLGDRLAKLGVEDALAKAGAVEGSPVTIGEVTFEWQPQTAAGMDAELANRRGSDRRLDRVRRASAEERKRASQARRGLIDEFQFEGEQADRERFQ
ncbi:GTPase ObgE [Corynebacterium sp. TAE3-ERU12]|uniref:GTPase ObgE n=1 Tax=Corynebacterium sp. TAE3-ERU12 TaxID=2849491 RepID=UPI001C4661E9|nr:GTPase ObgE [Corynebacterium sp. TAE3-ERU12]MBV7294978.1 GTPase ObgE [Corynebacterium sp. TAE3-ERU12]